MNSKNATEIVKAINGITGVVIDSGFRGNNSFWVKYDKDFWNPSVDEASAGCRPGKFDFTKACVLQEEKKKQFARTLKREIRDALGERAKGIKLFAINMAHHDKLQKIAGGVIFNR